MRGKYKVPPNPLEQEALSDKLEPDEKWTDKQVLSLAMRLGKNGNRAEQTAAGMIISQVKQKQWRSDAGRRFLRGFFMFLLGRLPDNVSKHSQFGQQPLYDDPEVRAYLEAFVQARTRFKVQLKKLTMSVPKGINQWYLYYKYIVLGKMLDPPNDPISDGTDIDYLDDWETFERAFDNAQGQDHFWPDHKWWPRPYRDKNDQAFDPFDPPPDDPPDNAGAPPPRNPRARPPATPPAPRQPPPTVPPPGPDINGLLDNFRQQLDRQHNDHRAQIAQLMTSFQPPPPPPAPAAVAVPTADDIAGAFAPFHQAQIAAIQQTHAEQMRQLADYHDRLSAQQEARHQQQVAWIQNNFPPPSDRLGVHSIDAESKQSPVAAPAPQLSELMRLGSFDVGGPGKGPEPPAAGVAVAVGGPSFSSPPRQQNVPVPLNTQPVQFPQPVQQLTGGFGGPRPDPGSGPVLASTAESMTDAERFAIAARATAEEQQRQEQANQRVLEEHRQQLEAERQARQLAEQQAAEAQQAAANREAEKRELIAQAQQAYQAHQRAQTSAGKSPLTYEEFMANPHAAALQEQAKGFASLWQETEAVLSEKGKKHAEEKELLAQQVREEQAARATVEQNAAAERRRAEAATAQADKERRARQLQAEQQRLADAAREKEERDRKAAEIEQEQRRKAAAVQSDIAAFNDRAAAQHEVWKTPPASSFKAASEPEIQPAKKQETAQRAALPAAPQRMVEANTGKIVALPQPENRTIVPDPFQVNESRKKRSALATYEKRTQKPAAASKRAPITRTGAAAFDSAESNAIAQQLKQARKAEKEKRRLEESARFGTTDTERSTKLARDEQEKVFANTTAPNPRKKTGKRKGKEEEEIDEKEMPARTKQAQEEPYTREQVAQRVKGHLHEHDPNSGELAPHPARGHLVPHADHMADFVHRHNPTNDIEVEQHTREAANRVNRALAAARIVHRGRELPNHQLPHLERAAVKHVLSTEERVAKKALIAHTEQKAAKLAAGSVKKRALLAIEHRKH